MTEPAPSIPGLALAHLEIVQPEVADPIIPLRFNPTEYVLRKQNKYEEVEVPGLDSPTVQFVSGGAEKLSLEALLDTSDTLEDVRERYTNKLRDLMRVNAELHAPPVVRFVWDTQIFVGVIDSMDFTYQLFSPDGVPLRAQVTLSLTEYRPVEQQEREVHTNSPDVDKLYQVRAGDTLDRIAAAAYRDPGRWREIARENKLRDPRRLTPGSVLALPRLR